jgi:hypothetical protein
MTLKVSTGLRNGLLATGSLKSQLALGFIKIYAGAVPADADASIGAATLLTTISVNSTGTGISFDAAAAAGTLAKAPAEVWSGVNVAAGTASFYRHVAPADDGTASSTAPRLQGAVAVAGAEMNLSSVALTNGATQTLDYYTVSLPSL